MNHNDGSTYLPRCFGYTSVKEKGIGIRFELCVSDARKRHVYTSSTNEVEIAIATEEGIDSSRFFIEFEGK